jgi:hypothetical protein
MDSAVCRKFELSMRAVIIFTFIASQAMSQPKCDLLAVAREYIVKQYPSFDAVGLQPVVSETGNSWEVTYDLPKGTLGGAPIITIDKQTCKVVRAQHSQ